MKSLGFGTTFVKYLLFIVNFYVSFGGFMMIVGGIMSLSLLQNYDGIISSFGIGYRGPAIAMIACGALIFVVAFLGCWGPFRENHTMLSTHGTILAILVIAQIVAIIAVVLVTSTKVKDDLEERLREGFRNSMYKYGHDEEVTTMWNSLQREVRCCGTTSYADWYTVAKSVPASCCKDYSMCPVNQTLGGLQFTVNTTLVYTQGCYEGILDQIKIHVKPLILYIVFAVQGIACLSILLACCLATKYRRFRSEDKMNLLQE